MACSSVDQEPELASASAEPVAPAVAASFLPAAGSLEQHLPAKTFLDLGELTFMDSSGIAVVLRAKRRMEALSGSLMVINIPRQAARVLETAGLARYVNLC